MAEFVPESFYTAFNERRPKDSEEVVLPAKTAPSSPVIDPSGRLRIHPLASWWLKDPIIVEPKAKVEVVDSITEVLQREKNAPQTRRGPEINGLSFKDLARQVGLLDKGQLSRELAVSAVFFAGGLALSAIVQQITERR